jgi:hypothetical protein
MIPTRVGSILSTTAISTTPVELFPKDGNPGLGTRHEHAKGLIVKNCAASAITLYLLEVESGLTVSSTVNQVELQQGEVSDILPLTSERWMAVASSGNPAIVAWQVGFRPQYGV